MPAIVIAAFLNRLKPSITAMRCFTFEIQYRSQDEEQQEFTKYEVFRIVIEMPLRCVAV